MSLAIDVDKVEKVLLADGWHVVSNQSLTMDAYEFVWYGTDGAESNRDPQVLPGTRCRIRDGRRSHGALPQRRLD